MNRARDARGAWHFSAGPSANSTVDAECAAPRGTARRASPRPARSMRRLPMSGGKLVDDEVHDAVQHDARDARTRAPRRSARAAGSRSAAATRRGARDAPIASRMPISRWRVTKRASNRFATFAQPIRRIRPNAKNSGMNTSKASAGRGTVPSPRRQHEARGGALAAGAHVRLRAARPTRRAARAPGRSSTPGASRPTTLRPPDAFGRLRARRLVERRRLRERRPEVGRDDLEPAETAPASRR